MSSRLPDSPLVSRVLEVCLCQLGNVELARRLGVTPVLVDMWRTGEAPIPQREFLILVDVLVSLNPGWEDWDKA